ncbi:hypothetical protein [Evansella cellulosilytica]|uniref:Uncharacterized protein n=1 Tax=Evansella cellulosilytica (strain ATCC 21833 / DSM 2522 / FERM P-1141 / JCM 9156 / N-4) TaxID=649639 RepID=E6TSP4_EVAC2|nr:hypothetical protein [Evansella cellulosilytica]ADU29552.1 hypothetical protein Bcell_1287 [Evansella cellulosilytica DSM 2522]
MNYTKLLLVTSAIFGVIGVGIGAHMAGSMSYAFRPIHAHMLVLGWLTLFGWAIYYKVFQPKSKRLMAWHAWSAIIGAIGLIVGMWFYVLNPLSLPSTFNLIFYIVGGMSVVLSFILFLIMAILQDTK